MARIQSFKFAKQSSVSMPTTRDWLQALGLFENEIHIQKFEFSSDVGPICSVPKTALLLFTATADKMASTQHRSRLDF